MKDTIKRMKIKSQYGKKFANYISHKGFVSRIYKKAFKTQQQENNPI